MTIETNFTEKERALLKRADDANQLPEMMEAVNDLEIENVQALLAAYIACRIDEISRAAPDIMSGAELLRTFLKIKNDWTEEEMGHLRKEMEYAKKMDPSVY
ncbi:hypothetical protein AGDE_07133 [Angomonas deanei]|uniref:Skp1 family, dimerisation domain containing protein, putative n=1 Tax=Angomonas deanei TaxID=59799 RepID=A0A7G2CQI7_9TRYP|nr:hypothetical protein AGDE_07133 [Angomonas deanei]CAD2220442.1 Skp1 family, dimerisation domain containing protein, putative [Angomonas deanei]|eukprot:EPY36000.1 hypothetical protein AGDE_07133 [Angomonas deanei]